MKNKKLSIIGFGNLGKLIAKYSLEQNYSIVSVFDSDNKLLHKDIGLILGTSPLKIYVEPISHLEAILKQTKPDICIISTSGLLKDLVDIIIPCVTLGINVLTSCEEAFYPQISSMSLYKNLNTLAIMNNCTISASGYQDIYWTKIVTDIISSCHNLKEIEGKSSYFIPHSNPSIILNHGIGLTKAEFESTIAKQNHSIFRIPDNSIESENFFPSFMWTIHGWLCSYLNLTLSYHSQKYIPILAKDKYVIDDVIILPNTVYGIDVFTETHTQEGIKIKTNCVGKIDIPNDIHVEETQWTIVGNSSTTIHIPSPSTIELTCASIVNRIPDIIYAPPGYLTTDVLPNLKYQK